VDEADKLQEPLNLEFIFWCWQAFLIPEVREFQLRSCMRHTPIIIYKSVTGDVTESQKAIHHSYVCYSLAINYSLYNQNCYRYPYNTKYGTDKDNGDVNGNKVKGIMTHVNNATIFYLEMLVGNY
jgi:hypothetical protein